MSGTDVEITLNIASLKMIATKSRVMGRFMWMIRGVAVEFAGQSVYPTMILRSSTAPLSLARSRHSWQLGNSVSDDKQ